MPGDLFLFVNGRRKSCKVLFWDGTGLCIFQKRLERGRFAAPWREDGAVVGGRPACVGGARPRRQAGLVGVGLAAHH